LENFDRMAEQLQRRLSGGANDAPDGWTQDCKNGCLKTYRATVAEAASSFETKQAGTRLVACYLVNCVDTNATLPIAVYRIAVNFRGRRGMDDCTVKEVIYRPGVTKGDDVSESVSLSRKGARFLRRFGFDGMRVWLMAEKGWALTETPALNNLSLT
jgi:hypothetical protein